MRRSIKKGIKAKSPFIRRPYMVSSYGFKINGMLLSIPSGKKQHVNIVLNQHTVAKLSENGVEPRSFTITQTSLAISVRKKVKEIFPKNIMGIDRNLRNVTLSTKDRVITYRTYKLLSIKENTTHTIKSMKRNDRRVMQKIYSKLGNRRTRRIQQHLHKISKDIVQRAKESTSVIVFEDLKGIRKLYRKGNGQGKRFRRRLNSWSFYELQRQILYKATWEGIPVWFVDPKRTSQLCPVCGERIQEDRFHRRKVWCSNCKRSMDRDVVASLNISYKGWSRFCHPRGLPAEAMIQEPFVEEIPQQVILKVDGSKLQVQR
jgi:putative transposase